MFQDRRRAQEDLVEERDIGFGQHSRRLGLDDAFAQAPQIDRPEDLARLGEAAQQILEVARAEDGGDAARGLALARARRTDDERMLAGDRRQRDELDERLAIDEPARGIGERLTKPLRGMLQRAVVCGVQHRRRSVTNNGDDGG